MTVFSSNDRAAELARAQARILELAMGDTGLHQTLEAITHTVEGLSETKVLASILILDEDGLCLRHGAAPSLPDTYNKAIDGIHVGPGVGSCGTVAFSGEPVYVSDIATNPLWANYRDVALSYGLRACWSTPVRSSAGKLLGTFALYYQAPREPDDNDIELISFVARSAGLVMERKQAEESLRIANERQIAKVEADLAASRDLVRELETSRAALASSEARQRAIFQSAIDFAMVIVDPHGIVTDWNPGAEHVMGWSPAEMIGQNAELFFTPEDRASGRIRHEMSRALQDGRASDDRWHLRKDGSRFWASGELMPLSDGSGEHIGFVKILRDRTDEHAAGIALKQAKDRFQTIVETIDAAFAIVKVVFDENDKPVNYRFVEVNPAFERQAGVDLQGKLVTEFAPDLEQFWFDTYGHVASTGEPATFENYAEAFKRWFDVRAVRVGDPADRQIAILFSDVTARHDTQERLRASEASARENAERVQLALGAGAIIGTWHWDLPSDQFAVDDGFAKAFGLDPALGRNGIPLAQIVETVHPDDKAGLADAIREVIKRGGPYAYQYRVRRADGRYYWIEANGHVDHGPDGTPLSFPGVVIDVEERRSIQAERDRALAALRTLNETLEQRVAERTAELMRAEEALRQAQKMEAVGQLTGGIAHDFNNMLTGVIGGLALVQRYIALGRMDRVDKYIETATVSAQRAAALTSRLLAFGRRQSLDLKPTDVNVLVASMEDLLHRTLGEQVALAVHLDGGVWSAYSDSNQLESALLNLCINARDAMPGGGKLTVETGNTQLDERYANDYADLQPGDYVVLSVTDTGTGMSESTVERAFEPFFTTKPMGQGTGLGLSMIYGFARQSGGHVRIYSELGKGTTVKLFLPRLHGALDEAQNLADSATPLGAGELVMVVEDDPSVRMIITEVLDELGYGVIEAVDAPTAIPILESNRRVDLLVTDVGLPGMNGRQLAEVARQSRPGLRILFITGYAENAAVRAGFLDTGMEMMTKPFAVDALAAKLRDMLANAGSPSGV
ncbi:MULTISPECIES: PAS domain S-box protein [unclassified Achromobacter]|uniref:PAS domain S-box protein n=1 Tax=unclassified Achromobacter TaxID=2626865 RepID=UPI00117739DF|nr:MULTISPECIES: PAS domain S-box protein [unclassified Achromobacter]